MELSSRVEYALLALIELADCHSIEKSLKISEIAARHSLPERYLEQILSTLRREGIVKSVRGAKGGYILVKEPRQIYVQEVIAVIDGERKPSEAEPETSTPEKMVINQIWLQASETTKTFFQKYTIQDLCQQRDTLRQENTMYYI
ncbi:MAG: Rrf2 family transcriptional regulator [Calothrix sp. FI2-JRJ7]|nr:Rrf2 family transcriptional regulator [Calothrix sp. FI2-JRJ7]